MQYHILGKTIEIFAMQKPEGLPGSIFEFRGNKALESIGLKERFYFQAPDKFSLDPAQGEEDKHPKKGIYQLLLSLCLRASISNGQLVQQGSF